MPLERYFVSWKAAPIVGRAETYRQDEGVGGIMNYEHLSALPLRILSVSSIHLFYRLSLRLSMRAQSKSSVGSM